MSAQTTALLLVAFVTALCSGCAEQTCRTDTDCGDNELCVASGGVLFAGRTCASIVATQFDAGSDVGIQDASTADAPSCEPESNEALCERLVLNCGEVTATDNCGVERTVNCGQCASGHRCGGGGTPNVCGCSAQLDEDFCASHGAQCGVLTAIDACDLSRTVRCGGCAPGAECRDNACLCTDSSGYTSPCSPIDECAAGTHDCAPDATCTDTAEGFECRCNAGFRGDGKTCAPAIRLEESHGVIGESTIRITTPELQADPEGLYVAIAGYRLSSNSGEPVSFGAVEGLGLTWARYEAQCSGHNGFQIEIWVAESEPTATGGVSLTFQTPPQTSSLVAFRFSGASAAGEMVARNAAGTSCSVIPSSSAYSLPLAVDKPGATVLGATMVHDAMHAEPAGAQVLFDEVSDISIRTAAFQLVDVTPGDVVVEGTFSSSAEWTAAAVEIEPAESP